MSAKENAKKVAKRSREIIRKTGDYYDAVIINKKDRADLNQFIDEFCEEKKPSKKDLETAELILRVAKSFFEFADIGLDDGNEGRLVITPQFMSDATYTMLLTAYLKHETEPYPYIPGGRDKVEISDSRLANSMDKIYKKKKKDAVTPGVANEKSLQEFIDEAYETAGLSKSDVVVLNLSPKVDGVSVNSKIKDSKFKKPSTRGDKTHGVHIKGLESFEVANISKETYAGQYEAFLTTKQLEAIEKIVGQRYESYRNAISGVIGRISTGSEFTSELIKHISLYPIECTLDMNYSDRRELFMKTGLMPKDMIEDVIVEGDRKSIIDKVQEVFDEWKKLRPTLSYKIDGMVITFVSKKMQKELGREGNTNKYQIAYKFEPENAMGIVSRVYLSNGSKGAKTIMVQLKDPVYLADAKCDTATIKSLEEFKEMQLREGDEIFFIRTGDAIPAVAMTDDCKRNPQGKLLLIHEHCDCCGTELIIHNSKYRCPNVNCPDNVKGLISNFFSVLDMKGYSDSFADTIYESGKVRKIRDVLDLSVEDLEKMGYKSKAREFNSALKKRLKDIKQHTLLESLGGGMIGQATSYEVCSISSLLDLVNNNSEFSISTKLAELDGFRNKRSSVVAASVAKSKEDIKAFWPYIDTKVVEITKVIGFSGTRAGGKLKKLIEDKGFRITEGKKFDILIAKKKDMDTPKYRDSVEAGIPIYTEDEFIKEFK